jgi:hypothetical protein
LRGFKSDRALVGGRMLVLPQPALNGRGGLAEIRRWAAFGAEPSGCRSVPEIVYDRFDGGVLRPKPWIRPSC